MNPKIEQEDSNKPQSLTKPVDKTSSDAVSTFLTGFLALLCRAVQTTPTSIMKQNPNARPNSPPASGGVSSIGY